MSAFLPQANTQSCWTTMIHGCSTVMGFCGEAIIWSKGSLKCWICYAVEVCLLYGSVFTHPSYNLSKDKKVVFVTNNATKSRRSYKSKFDQLGVQAHVVSFKLLSLWKFVVPISLIGRNLWICIRCCGIPFLRHQASHNKKGLCHWDEWSGGRTSRRRYHDHRWHG